MVAALLGGLQAVFILLHFSLELASQGKRNKIEDIKKWLETGENMPVENVASVDPSRHCVHNNVALCALTFKIVVLAWNRSHLPSIKEAFFFFYLFFIY